MIFYFEDETCWFYSEPTSILDAFGEFDEFPMVGRDTQLYQIWDEILSRNDGRVMKLDALYFHGMGLLD